MNEYERFEERPKYSKYRGEKVPSWWLVYLPEEKNPYSKEDKLYLKIGCLSEYWHTHSSNKHYSFKGVTACNYVQDMIKEEFGQAFLVGKPWAGHQGEHFYNDRTHVTYSNAEVHINETSDRLGNAYYEDGYICILNAHKYYEDVIRFIKKVLKGTMQKHYPSPTYYGRHGEDFFDKYIGNIKI